MNGRDTGIGLLPSITTLTHCNYLMVNFAIFLFFISRQSTVPVFQVSGKSGLGHILKQCTYPLFLSYFILCILEYQPDYAY